MKRAFKISFIISLSLVVMLAVIIAISVISASVVSANDENSEAIGIIGGADGPTAILITRTLSFENPIIWLACFLLLAVVVSAVGWAVSKK